MYWSVPTYISGLGYMYFWNSQNFFISFYWIILLKRLCELEMSAAKIGSVCARSAYLVALLYQTNKTNTHKLWYRFLRFQCHLWMAHLVAPRWPYCAIKVALLLHQFITKLELGHFKSVRICESEFKA